MRVERWLLLMERTVRTFVLTLMGTTLIIGAAGCSTYNTRVQRVPVAAAGDPNAQFAPERVKPLPEHAHLFDVDPSPAPPFNDPPLVNQKPPEQARFEEGYRAVGRPRMIILVNRTLDGSEADSQAKALDYVAVENLLTDFMSCQGMVEIMSPAVVRQKLTDEQLKELQIVKPRIPRELAQQLDADILIHVSAHPMEQTQQSGLEYRLTGEAVNIKGGQQIARAVVDIAPPFDKSTLNRYTRFVARKLMMDMTQAWSSGEAPQTNPPEKPREEKPPVGPEKN